VGANAQLESAKSYSFIDENGGDPGVRLRKRHQALLIGGNSPPDRDCSEHQIKTAKQPQREVSASTDVLRNEPSLLNAVRFRE
jgi:hypothetical protein